MNRYIKPLLWMSAAALLGCMLWPLVGAHMAEIKTMLLHFKHYGRLHPLISYALYTLALAVVLFSGLPVATALMLFAGVVYGFWEAATLVTMARLIVAVAAFAAARHWVHFPPRRRRRAHEFLLAQMERHPNVTLLVARLMPIPDGMVNYTVAVSPIRSMHYVLVSLVGMIPFTLACVWFGSQLGSVHRLLAYLS
jgi:uncharacterized membrane protein YdjX (TVP38/TMEM64 family)